MNCYIFFKESYYRSIFDVRKQVCCNICLEIVDHRNVEVVDRIPDYPQDNNEDESSANDDQEKLSNSGDFNKILTKMWIMTMILSLQKIKMS